MALRGYLVGSFPRPAKLIKLLRDYSKGKTGREQVESEVDKTVEMIVRIQVENKLAYVSDGMLLWDDLFRPFSTIVDGVEVDGLSRWFDNNVFYKKLVVKDRLVLKKPLGEMFYKPAGNHPSKLILPDPYTAATLSENNYYKSFEEHAYDWAEVIGQTAASVKDVQQLQLTAPSLVFEKTSKEHLETAKECVRIVRNKARCELLIHTPFGSLSNALPDILDFPVDVVGVDLLKTRMNQLSEYNIDKHLYLGVLDGRNTLAENVETVVSTIENLFSKTGLKNADVGPTCELEFLPFEPAVDKVKKLGEVLERAAEKI
ncbi:MAG: hypothetical protein QXS50_06395 [Candidatus Caldarchaeum sp.]